MYVEFDKEIDELKFNLPQELKAYFSDLNECFLKEFAYEPINKDNIKKMNAYIKEWFVNKGIELPEEENIQLR